MDIAELRAQLERHHRESYGWARNCCRDHPDDAEGVLQTVYLKILERKAVFNGRASFRTWLFAVIRKTAAEERRRRAWSKLRLVPYPEVVQPASPAERADDAVYRSQIQATLGQALAALPRRQREVLQLVFYHDLSLADAAQVMSVSLGSASRHYDRGKKRLRELMEGANIR